jgi:hypothetical protein
MRVRADGSKYRACDTSAIARSARAACSAFSTKPRKKWGCSARPPLVDSPKPTSSRRDFLTYVNVASATIGTPWMHSTEGKHGAVAAVEALADGAALTVTMG